VQFWTGFISKKRGWGIWHRNDPDKPFFEGMGTREEATATVKDWQLTSLKEYLGDETQRLIDLQKAEFEEVNAAGWNTMSDVPSTYMQKQIIDYLETYRKRLVDLLAVPNN
jgi:hypothetical protein